MNPRLPKLIAIVGPTASGKSDLAIAIARRHGGEIVSADSRQVYRGLDIGSGKVTRDPVSRHPEPAEGSPSIRRLTGKNIFFSEGIRHHLLDVASPKREYNISHFLRDAKRVVADIESRGKLPIVCGGTHFWVQALLEDTSLPPVPPNPVLRKRLEQLSAKTLLTRLRRRDPRRAATIDPLNKIRLIRALEIIDALGTVPLLAHSYTREANNPIVIALVPNTETLRANITTRLKKRFRRGMLAEIRRLHASGVAWKRLESFGLEYRACTQHLRGFVGKEEMEKRLVFEIWHFAKRQRSWLRRWERQGQVIRSHETSVTALADVSFLLAKEKRA